MCPQRSSVVQAKLWTDEGTTMDSTARPTTDSRQPPGPRGLPLIGGLVPLWRDPLGNLLRGTRDYGDIVRLGAVGPAQLYLLNNPEYIRHVLIENHRNYGKGNLAGVFKALVGDGLPMAEGETWHRQRRLMQPAFHQKQVDGFV